MSLTVCDMYSLLPHPHSLATGSLRPAAIEHCTASLTRQANGDLQLCYRLQGQPGQLRLPPAQQPAFADNLWQHTCFEAFFRPAGGTAYREFNFSPSGQWAVYDFSAYRERMAQPCLSDAAPIISLSTPAGPQSGLLQLCVTLPAALLPAAEHACQLSLTAVLEDNNGQCSYWATHHAGERPDFHHPDAFTLSLA